MTDMPTGLCWLYEDGIGEARAALVHKGAILEARIERHDGGARAGAVLPGRLAETVIPKKRGIVRLDGGDEVLVEPIPPGVPEGSTVLVQILRETLAEPGLDGDRRKRAIGRIMPRTEQPRAAPGLREEIAATGLPVQPCLPTGPDVLEQCGWSELCDEAMRGEIVHEDVALRIFPTPAMTLIDVDGSLPPAKLGPKGARLAAEAIRRLGIAGNIGIDLPTMNNKDERLIAAAQIDKALPQPFERTAVNGFGFVQIVRRRERASIMELLRSDPATSAALAALRMAERHDGGAGPVTIDTTEAVARVIRAHPDWLAMLERRRGGPVCINTTVTAV